jgi:hypothetical protein
MNPRNSTSIPSTHGDVLTAISDGMVALLKEFYGRGPTRAKSYYEDDLVVCVLRGGFSRVEQTLLGEQWGMMNETGSYPGQVWLLLYTLWYHARTEEAR